MSFKQARQHQQTLETQLRELRSAESSTKVFSFIVLRVLLVKYAYSSSPIFSHNKNTPPKDEAGLTSEELIKKFRTRPKCASNEWWSFLESYWEMQRSWRYTSGDH